MSDSFELRAAVESDVEKINVLANSINMPPLDSAEEVKIAVTPEGRIVGYIHVLAGQNGAMHVQSVASDPTWRGKGVGRALMEDAYAAHGDLRLVARGTAVGFYQTLGYEETPWESIDFTVADDCFACDERDTCHPLPMRKKD